jgi:hypothetical protein
MTNDREWYGCYTGESVDKEKEACPFLFEHHTNEKEAFYDIFASMIDGDLVFQSTMRKNGTGLSELLASGGDALVSINSYTEPTAEAIEAMINRMKKLLIFS